MPTYVYRRNDGTTFEVFQRISDEPLQVDPETGQAVERVISGGAGLQFKGTGFYLTDYARKSTNGGASNTGSSDHAAEPTKASESASSSPSDTKTDSTSS
ncbi:MAG: zinc ribbon domain-containing protein [Rhodothermaceae bacterium]|nr:zinc ribbon domain-containing protein [Rhodothermaceae bacterium]